MSNFVYERALEQYSKSNEADICSLYNSSLKKLFCSHFIYNGNSLLYIEYLSPFSKGKIDSNKVAFIENHQVFDSIITETIESMAADKIEALVNDEESIVDEKAKEIQNILENSDSIEKLLTSKALELKVLEFQEELLILDNDSKVQIEQNDKTVYRKFFDDNFRLIKKEEWIKAKIKDSKIIKSDFFEYFDNSLIVKEKIELSEKNKNVYRYNPEGLVTKIYEYDIHEENEYLINKMFFSYDDNKRLIFQKIVNNKYKDDKYTKISNQSEKSYKYFYNNGDEIPADSEYYENGKLLIKTIYSSVKGEYTEEVFFEGGLSVKTFYKDSLRIKDVYYENGKKNRVVVYE